MRVNTVINRVGTIKDLQDKEDLQFVSNDHDVQAINEYFGLDKTDNNFEAFLF